MSANDPHLILKVPKATSAAVWEAARLLQKRGFRTTKEKLGPVTLSVIAVVGPSSGSPLFVTTAAQRNFVFEKKDGAWQMGLPAIWEEKKKPNQALEPTRGAVTPRAP